jgi:septal ring factor EnvC (AmiA/AmiB activator)
MGALAPILALLVLLSHSFRAQESRPDLQRIEERVRSLQREADRLAAESGSLVGDLRKREVDRDLKVERLRQAQAATIEAERLLQNATDRLSDLELRRISQLPDVKTQLVDIYKRGRSGYARLLFSAGDLREFSRAARAVGALTTMTERRLAEHRRTLEALQQERAVFETRAREFQAQEASARRLKTAADAAVASAGALLRQIDSRRDLTAQYVGELQVAYNRIEEQVTALAAGRSTDEVVAVPIRPFQGSLEWPAAGRVLGAFGQPATRLGGSVARNGIEISADEDEPVRAVHGGTVGFAGPFTGFGTLVILDHGGDNYSLYGYLASTEIAQGDTVDSGAEVGRVGLAPAGPAALYFEMRIDGRSVNPVQWLKPR